MKLEDITRDLAREQRFASFLDGYVFPVLRESGVPVERVHNRVLDKRGIDATVGDSLVDIKAHEAKELAAAQPLRFAFELQTRYRLDRFGQSVSDPHPGWLVSDKKVTEKYLFCYYMQQAGCISSVLLTLVGRNEILREMRKRGIDLSLPANQLRASAYRSLPQANGSVKYYFSADEREVSMTLSKQIPEQPLNLVVGEGIIKRICDWQITREYAQPVCW